MKNLTMIEITSRLDEITKLQEKMDKDIWASLDLMELEDERQKLMIEFKKRVEKNKKDEEKVEANGTHLDFFLK